MEIKRTSKSVNYFIEIYHKMGIDFSLKHGTYTTTIETMLGKQKFVTNKYSNRVFVAANMIKKDVINSVKGQRIISGTYKKTNYANSRKYTDLSFPEVLNIDLNSAYASCLLINDLITQKTFDYLKGLKKEERLPCVGMLAQSNTTFIYEGGKCVDMKPFRAPTYQVFYYLISEINYLMNDIQFELGNDFIFYWVDGVFFMPDTKPSKIRNVENMVQELGYSFKYEEVKDFRYTKILDKFVVEMTKNKDHKRYEFQDSEIGLDLRKELNARAKNDLKDKFTFS